MLETDTSRFNRCVHLFFWFEIYFCCTFSGNSKWITSTQWVLHPLDTYIYIEKIVFWHKFACFSSFFCAHHDHFVIASKFHWICNIGGRPASRLCSLVRPATFERAHYFNFPSSLQNIRHQSATYILSVLWFNVICSNSKWNHDERISSSNWHT